LEIRIISVIAKSRFLFTMIFESSATIRLFDCAVAETTNAASPPMKAATSVVRHAD
jgi:hypothetical protein